MVDRLRRPHGRRGPGGGPPPAPPPCAPRRERGSVTAEIAVALPSLLLVLGIALGAVEAAATHVACVDAARIGARALARGEAPEAARVTAARAAPAGAGVELTSDARYAHVTVRAPVRLGPIESALTVGGRAATPLEPAFGEPA